MRSVFVVSISEKCSQKYRKQEHLESVAHYTITALIRDLESQHGDPDHLKNLINCSLYHCRATLKI